MKKLLLIYNATSGKGRISEYLSAITDILTKLGWLVTTYPTQRRSDATAIVKEIGADYERIVCCGGDGTLSETAAGLLSLENKPILGYIPAGSTNDCATSLNLPKDDFPRAAVLVGSTGDPKPWDVGTLNGRPFVYVAAFGAFTSVAYDTPQELKKTFGHLAYIMGGMAAIPGITPYNMRIEYDDQVIEGEFYYGMVCNTISIGGVRALPTDRVKVDDGRFEVVLVRRPTSLADVTTSLISLIRQEQPTEGSVMSFHASRLNITCEKPIPWTIDGEYGGNHQRSEVKIHHNAITILRG